jgi:hypothetical protein
MYNKAQFENPKHLHQTTFETFKYQQQTMYRNCLFRRKWNKFASTKSSPKSHHFFGLHHVFKNSKSHPIGEKLPNLVTLIFMKDHN